MVGLINTFSAQSCMSVGNLATKGSRLCMFAEQIHRVRKVVSGLTSGHAHSLNDIRNSLISVVLFDAINNWWHDLDFASLVK